MNKDEIMALGVEESVAEALWNENEAMKKEYEDKLKRVMRDNEIDIALRESGAKNIKIVRALIEEGDDFKEQIENLKKGEDTRFLFEGKKSFTPYRSSERLPDMKNEDYLTRLNKARKEGNTIEAIRIKQKAAGEGIMLI